ncbi:MAG: acyltransferase [Candidatus Omnitrophica bacterium]|nr:acyltransferase [Candidatus Omnitrophota bacterium]
MQKNKTERVHFPGLNGLRFISAVIVVIHHLEKSCIVSPNRYYARVFLENAGYTAVTFFFVISGFLITYLLLVEKQRFGINIKYFYIRRILRIWPLYYFIIFLSFFSDTYVHT